MKRRVSVEGVASEKRTTIMDLPDEILSEEIFRKLRKPVDLWCMTRATMHWYLLYISMTNPYSGLELVHDKLGKVKKVRISYDKNRKRWKLRVNYYY